MKATKELICKTEIKLQIQKINFLLLEVGEEPKAGVRTMPRDLGTCCHPLRRPQGQYVARNNDPFLREWVHLSGRLAPTSALHPACPWGASPAACT